MNTCNLGFSRATNYALNYNGLNTTDILISYSIDELKQFPKFGDVTINEVVEAMHSLGLKFKNDNYDIDQSKLPLDKQSIRYIYFNEIIKISDNLYSCFVSGCINSLNELFTTCDSKKLIMFQIAYLSRNVEQELINIFNDFKIEYSWSNMEEEIKNKTADLSKLTLMNTRIYSYVKTSLVDHGLFNLYDICYNSQFYWNNGNHMSYRNRKSLESIGLELNDGYKNEAHKENDRLKKIEILKQRKAKIVEYSNKINNSLPLLKLTEGYDELLAEYKEIEDKYSKLLKKTKTILKKNR